MPSLISILFEAVSAVWLYVRFSGHDFVNSGRLTFENGRYVMGQPGNLLARLSSRRRETPGHYREVGRACSAGGFSIALLIFLIVEVVFEGGKRRYVPLDCACRDFAR